MTRDRSDAVVIPNGRWGSELGREKGLDLPERGLPYFHHFANWRNASTPGHLRPANPFPSAGCSTALGKVR